MTTNPFEKGKLSRALDHFTRADQVDQLVEAREADPDRGFMARLLTLCSLPRTDPGERKEYIRRNGPFTLFMNATGGQKLPYGTLPRLLLAWMCTEAVRTQSRDLVLGRSLSKFMEKLGMAPVGSGRTRLRNQMHRFFNAVVRLAYSDAEGEASMGGAVASRIELWWNPKRPDQPTLWESRIRLGEELFEEIIRNPIPSRCIHSRPSSGLPWASISTCGSPTACSLWRSRSPCLGSGSTGSSERTQVKRMTGLLSVTFGQSVCGNL